MFIYLEDKPSWYNWGKISQLLGLFVVSLMIITSDSKLFFATCIGVIVMFLVYQKVPVNWRKIGDQWSKFRQTSNGKLAFAITSGGITTVISYIIASIWENAENHWLALETILQDFTTTAIFGLLGWHIFSRKTKENQDKFTQLLTELSAPSPLQRLIAVNSLTELVKTNQLTSTQQNQIQEYFQLMLTIESEAKIRHSLLKNLLIFNPNKPLRTPLNHSQPLQPLSPLLIKTKINAELKIEN
jgi:hypothetical protein